MSKPVDILTNLGLPPLPSQSPDTIAALLWAREVLQKYLSRSYAVSDPKGIEELKAVDIGGVKQWLHIRGRNRDNPVLLYLHGGPGESMIGHMDGIQRPWEDYFTVVQWDQRQTGKSYYPSDDENNPLYIEQFINDACQVTAYLRDFFEQQKIFILGHSWGSVLGMHLVKQHPDWLHAYIGVGQVVNSVESEKTLYQRLLHHAKEKNKNELVSKIEAILPMLDLPSPQREMVFAENCSMVRMELSVLAGETVMRHLPLPEVIALFNFDRLISPHINITDLSNAILGDKSALLRPPYTSLTKDFMDIDLPNQVGSSFDVPIFFFSGRHDYQTPVTLSDKWFGEIDAPHKELIHFEESSHMIVNEEPGRVVNALVNRVLPIAQVSTQANTARAVGIADA